ncbi:ADP-ribosyltransferase [Candidatus Pacearchaeota archaeon]|nr:ADP-ribosyltransferase [Candidatus Pacearchaeota archaeon]
MSFPGPRPRKEPSPPFKDPNPDKAKALASLKSGKKIVKLTKIGERIKKKIESKNKNLWTNKLPYEDNKGKREEFKRFGSFYKEIIHNLSQTEKQALRDYIHGNGVNDALRAEGYDKIIKGKNYGQCIKTIDILINKTSIPYDTITYRGITPGMFEDLKKYAGKKISTQDQGYTSVSLDEKTAKTFAKVYGEPARYFYLKIKIKKGQKGLYVGNASLDVAETTSEFGGVWPQRELILPRDSEFIIGNIKDNTIEMIYAS